MLDTVECERLLDTARREVGEMDRLPPFDVEVDAHEDSYARLLVKASDGQLTPLFGFARKLQGDWRVLSWGTDFDPAFYEAHAIPVTLRLP